MSCFKSVKKIDGTTFDLHVRDEEDLCIDASHLLALPALIDPHVHFRVPGAEHKEDWISAATAAIHGGVTTVIDMPNNFPPCTTLEQVLKKKQLINQQLIQAQIPLHYHLYIGADRRHLKEIVLAKSEIIGIKVFMGSSTGDLLIEDDQTLEEIFRIAADCDLLVSVHAEDEKRIAANKKLYANETDPSIHSTIRDPEAARIAVDRAIQMAVKYHARLCILHMSTKGELDLLREAKKSRYPIYGEASPHHLLLSKDAYARWGTKVQVNPPLRNQEECHYLWEAIHDGTIDFIGTDHAPHLSTEKSLPYGKAPSGIPSIELYLSLLLNEGLNLERLVDLTRTNIEKIFRLPTNNDWVLVDMNRSNTVDDENLKTKCRWSPYCGHTLKGWPVFTILNHKVFLVGGKELCHTL